MKDIEDLHHRRVPISRRAGEAAAKPGEVRAAIGAQADELAVKRHATLAERAGDVGQLGKSAEQSRPLRVRRETARPS